MNRLERMKEIVKANPDFGKRVGYKMSMIDELEKENKILKSDKETFKEWKNNLAKENERLAKENKELKKESNQLFLEGAKRVEELEAQIEKMKRELHHRLVSPSKDESDCLDKIIGLDRLWQFGEEF